MSAPGSTVGEVSGRVGGLVVGDPDIWLGDVTHDSALAGPQVLFVAVKGRPTTDTTMSDRRLPPALRLWPSRSPLNVPVTQIVVGDTRAAMGPMAARVHGDPSAEMAVVGVTGTNGKTTVTHYIESLLTSVGRWWG